MARNVEFDFKENIWDQKSRFAALCDQFMKAEVWYHENLKPTQEIFTNTAHTHQGSTLGKCPVLYVELELMGDEIEFIKTALAHEFNRRF